MSQNHLDSYDTASKSPDVPHWQTLSQRHPLRENLRAFFSRFLALAREPRHFAPLVVDYWLLLQATWSGRQLGPDVVYPMLSIRKRQSGRLARLILEHCRTVRQYKLLIDLDEVPHHVVESGYSTPVDLYGLMCLLMLFETLITFTIHVFYFFNWGWFTWLNWIRCGQFNMLFCFFAVFLGDGTLTLARRSDTSISIPFPGCAVLLDQDFTVVLNGSQSVVEAIAESSFTLSHPNSVWRLGLGGDDHGRDSSLSYNLLEGLCEAACFIILVSCWLLFRPSTSLGRMAPMVIVAALGLLSQRSPPDHFTPLQVGPFIAGGFISRVFPPLIFLMIYEQGRVENSYFAFGWQRESHFLSLVLFVLFLTGYRTRNYPTRTAKFLDALGHPRVRKWQFDTLAAAATFQCLVLCREIARPIRSIQVPALLDLLVPDQRDVWKAWKERVADRIVHETEILYAPTIPTFGDERQQQLKELLDQAQLGDAAYRGFYVWRSVP